ncbi:MAG: DUF4197 family protein [Verrucomicrobiia bacterium]
MKTKAPLLAVLIACALSQTGFCQAQQSQSLRDLLQGIQPGQATAPAAAPQPAQSAQAPSPTVVAPPAAQAPEFKPVFMSIVTNYHLVTNRVIVTNYVVSTNLTFTTNYYNAQGQLMTPLQPAPTLQPAAAAPAAVAAPKPVAPDPAVVKANQVRAIRELLALSATGASNTVAAPGAFSRTPSVQIRIPEGVTVFDRRKGETLTDAMNKAAENAAPAALALVQKTVAQLNPAEPAQILQGGNDAATRFLLSSEGQKLTDQIMGLVQTSAANARVSEAYNAVMLRGGGLLGAVLGTAPSVDMNAHITKGLVEAIFLNLASEENRIRTDPTVSKSKILQDALKK